MGREATCRCRWGTEEAEVRALLESHDLILRGGMRRTVPFTSIEDLSADEHSLKFRVDKDWIELELGKQAAQRWAKAIAEPPSLAKKLGITSGKPIRVIGAVQDEALRSALSRAASESDDNAELIILIVQTPEELRIGLAQWRATTNRGAPVWVIYPKGKGNKISEAQVRESLRESGMIDTKVASVSERLTALRFSQRKAEP